MSSLTWTFLKTFVNTILLGGVIMWAVCARPTAPLSFLASLLHHPFAASSWAQAADLSPLVGKDVVLASPTGTVICATTWRGCARLAAAEASRDAYAVLENERSGEVLYVQNGTHARVVEVGAIKGRRADGNEAVRVKLIGGARNGSIVFIRSASIQR